MMAEANYVSIYDDEPPLHVGTVAVSVILGGMVDR